MAFSVVCPLFLMMALGYFLQHVGLFTKEFLRQLNQLCFRVFFPCILFINIYDSDFSTAFRPKLILFALLSVLVLFLVMMALIPKVTPDDRRRGVLVQGIVRSNFVLFGLPIVSTLFGSDHVGTAAVLIAFVVPVFNLVSVVTLETFRGGKFSIRRIVSGVVTNPLIIAALVAFLFVLSGLRLPGVVEHTVRDISKITTPLSLIVLGASFSFSSMWGNRKALAWAVSARLLLIPLFFLSIAIALGFRGVALGALLSMFASPTAVGTFTMAQQVDADSELAGQIVAISSTLSVLTIFLWISALMALGVLGL